MSFHPLLPRLLTALCLLQTVAIASVTVTLRPDSTTPANGDAFVTTGPTNNLTGNNYGAAGALAVTAALTRGTFDSVIRMDLATAKSQFDTAFGAGLWSIDSIVLELTSANASPNNTTFNSPNTAGQFEVRWFGNDAWTEGTGNPTNPSTSGVRWSDITGLVTGEQSLGTFSYVTTGTQQFSLSQAAGLVGDVNAGTQASLHLLAADGVISALFNSRTNGVAASRPALIITASAVPEPARASLALVGMLVLHFRRRR
jgi:hypothetical protein